MTSQELSETLTLQKFRKNKIGRLAKELGYINEESLDKALEAYFKPSCGENISQLIKMRDEILSSVQFSKQEKVFLKNYQLEPIKVTDKEITLVGSRYSDFLIQRTEETFHCNILLNYGAPSYRHITLKTLPSNNFHLLCSASASSHGAKPSKIILSRDITDESKLEEESPYSKLIRESIDEALKLGASDIHYEPFHSKYVIRFRIHGLLSDWKIIDGIYSKAITVKLKSILNMDPALVGHPQDSRASLENRKVDVRASSFPVVGHGEKIVLRIQRGGENVELEDLGLSSKSYNKLLSTIQKNEGLILISGPTGSGKTTTLYSLLHKMDKYGKNISTIENPVEKQLDRISQANISDYKSFATFEAALMRQDPDTILIGEVRDKNSADLCMRLASTGHLVLSTIHANGALEVVERLKSLGVDDFSIQSNLQLSVAQRLVKRICPHCSKSADEKLQKEALKRFGWSHEQMLEVAKIHHLSFKVAAPKGLDPSGELSADPEDGLRTDSKKELKTNSEEELRVGPEESFKGFRVVNPKGCKNCQKGVVGRMAVIEYADKEKIISFMESRGSSLQRNPLSFTSHEPKLSQEPVLLKEDSLVNECLKRVSLGIIDIQEIMKF